MVYEGPGAGTAPQQYRGGYPQQGPQQTYPGQYPNQAQPAAQVVQYQKLLFKWKFVDT